VIVAATRSPIGRAFKGSLVSIRPDDLAAQLVRAALDQVPQLDPSEIDDLMLGCGQPGGEQGFNTGECCGGARSRSDRRRRAAVQGTRRRRLLRRALIAWGHAA